MEYVAWSFLNPGLLKRLYSYLKHNSPPFDALHPKFQINSTRSHLRPKYHNLYVKEEKNFEAFPIPIDTPTIDADGLIFACI